MSGPEERRTTTAIASSLAGTLDWRAAYEQHAPDLVRFLRRFLRSDEAAQDLVQDTFVRALRAGRTPPQAELRPWLFRIASNLALDELRRGNRFAFLPFTAALRIEAPSYEEVDQIRHALRSIAPEQALALTLALHEGFSRREIAGMTGVSEETVKSRLARGRLAFAAAYERIEGGEKR